MRFFQIFIVVCSMIFGVNAAASSSASSSIGGAYVEPTLESVLEEIKTTGKVSGLLGHQKVKIILLLDALHAGNISLMKNWQAADYEKLFLLLFNRWISGGQYTDILVGLDKLIHRYAQQVPVSRAIEIVTPLLTVIILNEYFDKIKSKRTAHLKKESWSGKTIVYNQDAFGITQDPTVEGATIHKGRPLEFTNRSGKKIPIGYNIHLPAGEIKAVIVAVYGGYQKTHLEKEKWSPGLLPQDESQLLEKGVAIIKLNLADLLKSKVFSGQMPQKFHDDILHASINHFFKTIKHYPGFLSPTLRLLENKKIFLKGSSFGGRTAVRHAEMYPKTYDGYISHAGWLRPDQLGERLAGRGMVAHLNPIPDDEIRKISEPILLLHNVNDNNVDIRASLDFLKKAKELGKGKLVRVFFPSVGNDSSTEKYNIGHFLPGSQKLLKLYIDTIYSFVTKGLSGISALSDWRADRAERERGGVFEKESPFWLLSQYLPKHIHAAPDGPLKKIFTNIELDEHMLFKNIYFSNFVFNPVNLKNKDVQTFFDYLDEDSTKINKIKMINEISASFFEDIVRNIEKKRYFVGHSPQQIKDSVKTTLHSRGLDNKIDLMNKDVGVLWMIKMPEIWEMPFFKSITNSSESKREEALLIAKSNNPHAAKAWRQAAKAVRPGLKEALKRRRQPSSSGAASSSGF